MPLGDIPEENHRYLLEAYALSVLHARMNIQSELNLLFLRHTVGTGLAGRLPALTTCHTAIITDLCTIKEMQLPSNCKVIPEFAGRSRGQVVECAF